MSETDARLHRYPNAFRYGLVFGMTLQYATRMATKEPLAARPFSYLTVGLVCGMVSSYYDYWKRVAMEDVLYQQNTTEYH